MTSTTAASHEDPEREVENLFAIYLVAKQIMDNLKFEDLKALRLVCNGWKLSTDELFYERAVAVAKIRPSNIDEDCDNILSSQRISLRIPSDLETEILFMRVEHQWELLKVLKLEQTPFCKLSSVLDACYALTPNLVELEIKCWDAYSEVIEVIPRFSDDQEQQLSPLLRNRIRDAKLLKLKTFSFKLLTCDRSVVDDLGPKKLQLFVCSALVKILYATQQLSKLTFNINHPCFLAKIMRDLLALNKQGQPFPWIHHLTFFNFTVCDDYYNPNSWGAAEFLGLITHSCPLQELNIERDSDLLPLLKYFPSYVTGLKRMEINYSNHTTVELCENPLDGSPWAALGNLTRLKLAEVEFGTIHSKINLVAFCPRLQSLSVHLQSGSELLEPLISSAVFLKDLKTLEIDGYVYDEEILGYNICGDIVVGICGLTGLRRLIIRGGNSELTCRCVVEGLFQMPSLGFLYLEDNTFCFEMTLGNKTMEKRQIEIIAVKKQAPLIGSTVRVLAKVDFSELKLWFCRL